MDDDKKQLKYIMQKVYMQAEANPKDFPRIEGVPYSCSLIARNNEHYFFRVTTKTSSGSSYEYIKLRTGNTKPGLEKTLNTMFGQGGKAD